RLLPWRSLSWRRRRQRRSGRKRGRCCAGRSGRGSCCSPSCWRAPPLIRGISNLKGSIGGMFKKLNIKPNERPRLLGELGDLSHAKVSASEFKYSRNTEIFGEAEPADY